MSKWQLPTQKGTELWPTATRSPVKIVFEGVAVGSPQARELLNRFGGQINQFYLGAAQSCALGVVEQSGTRRESPELVMSYSNNRGVETVRVSPATKKTTQKDPRAPDPTKLFDCVLVSLTTRGPELLVDAGTSVTSTLHLLGQQGENLPFPVFADGSAFSDASLEPFGWERASSVEGVLVALARFRFSFDIPQYTLQRNEVSQSSTYWVDLSETSERLVTLRLDGYYYIHPDVASAATAPVDIGVAAFHGKPPWVSANITTPNIFVEDLVWVIRSDSPKEVQSTLIAENRQVPVVRDEYLTPFGQKRIGDIVFDRLTGAATIN